MLIKTTNDLEFDCLEGAAGALGPPLKSTDSKTPKPAPGLKSVQNIHIDSKQSTM